MYEIYIASLIFALIYDFAIADGHEDFDDEADAIDPEEFPRS